MTRNFVKTYFVPSIACSLAARKSNGFDLSLLLQAREQSKYCMILMAAQNHPQIKVTLLLISMPTFVQHSLAESKILPKRQNLTSQLPKLGPNVSRTPLWQQSFRQCLPVSWTILRGKYCRHPIVVMGVVDKFGLDHVDSRITIHVKNEL